MTKDIIGICPACAYSVTEGDGRFCPYCRSELIWDCPICHQPFHEKKSLYCAKCGEKLRMSYVPIQ